MSNFDFLKAVGEEVERAEAKHPKFPTMHHGLAVIWEEFDELKQEIFKKVPDKENLKSELIQTAAMCLRFYNDLLQEDENEWSDHLRSVSEDERFQLCKERARKELRLKLGEEPHEHAVHMAAGNYMTWDDPNLVE